NANESNIRTRSKGYFQRYFFTAAGGCSETESPNNSGSAYRSSLGQPGHAGLVNQRLLPLKRAGSLIPTNLYRKNRIVPWRFQVLFGFPLTSLVSHQP